MYFSEIVADFACQLSFEDLPEEVVAAALTAIADTLACAVAAIDEPDRVFCVITPYVTMEAPAQRCWAKRRRSLRGLLLSSTAVWRADLDANDLYAGTPGRDTGHFSDAIPALLAVAESTGASGRDLITAVVIAYEVQAVLAESYLWMKRGLHSVSQVTWVLPAAAGRLLGLDRDQIVSAIGLAGTTGGLILQSWLRPSPSLPLIKGGAPGFAAKQALEATELAHMGFTAPSDALETLFERLPSESDTKVFQNLVSRIDSQQRGTCSSAIRPRNYTQAAVQAAVAIHPHIDNVEQIAVATVYGHQNVAAGVQGSAGAYVPTTRGAADHSTPFVVAVALRDGDRLRPAIRGSPGRTKRCST